MKKTVSLVLAVVLALSLFACGKASVSLDKAEHTFTAAGETVQLSAESKDAVTWTSSDESVATVDSNGLVTAVAPGTATITATAGELSATCTVKCEWSNPVDLLVFYENLYAELYPMGADGYSTGPAVSDLGSDPAMMDMFYPGLSEIELKQLHLFFPLMTGVPYEVILVEVANAEDVEAVKAIFQARIDSETANQNYPTVIENWELNSRIVSNGNYILMAVTADCDAYVDAFNAQF